MKWCVVGVFFASFWANPEPAYPRSYPDFVNSNDLKIKTFLSTAASQQVYPRGNFLYSDHTDTNWGTDFRIILSGQLTPASHFEMNILEQIQSKPPLKIELNNSQVGTGRSGLFTWEQHDSSNSRAELSVDTAYYQRQSNYVDLTIGRQPINLASTFYFTPNDFFEPFAAQTFYRAYKAGVDAIRAEISLANLYQLTILAVLSYDSSAANDWHNGPNWPETSFLARITRNSDLFEWSFITGTVNEYTVAGGSLQGELFNWLGVRAEGHYGEPETGSQQSYYQIAAGVEHFHENSIFWRLEFFYNQRGSSSIQAASQDLLSGLGATQYLGRHYTALGISYEFTPLLTGTAMTMANLSDDSHLFSFNLVYSLSDESEISATVSRPGGDKPDLQQLGSEFGSQPSSLSCVYRLYF